MIMGFEKIDDFLGTELNQDGVKVIQEWKIYLDKLFRFGGEVFCEILNKQNLGKDDTLPTIMFFRNSIELIGSISTLLVNFYSEPARIILRTLLESSLYIEYISQKDISKRSLSFLICHYHDKLSSYYKLLPDSQQNKQMKKQLENDEYLTEIKVKDTTLLKLHIENLEKLIKTDLYHEVEEEYKRTKQIKGKRPVWYELFNGPNSIDKLAYHLNKGSLYEVIYRDLSKGTHGKGIIDGFISGGDEEGIAYFKQIRFPYSAQFVCQHTITLALNIFRNIIKCQLPSFNDKYKEFYKNEIRDFFLLITKKELLTID